MKTVRVFFKKLGRMKFISHLDMTRFMSRLITKANIPVWYTEGFNQHLYMNFAVPLSLGFEGLYEVSSSGNVRNANGRPIKPFMITGPRSSQNRENPTMPVKSSPGSRVNGVHLSPILS